MAKSYLIFRKLVKQFIELEKRFVSDKLIFKIKIIF